MRYFAIIAACVLGLYLLVDRFYFGALERSLEQAWKAECKHDYESRDMIFRRLKARYDRNLVGYLEELLERDAYPLRIRYMAWELLRWSGFSYENPSSTSFKRLAGALSLDPLQPPPSWNALRAVRALRGKDPFERYLAVRWMRDMEYRDSADEVADSLHDEYWRTRREVLWFWKDFRMTRRFPAVIDFLVRPAASAEPEEVVEAAVRCALALVHGASPEHLREAIGKLIGVCEDGDWRLPLVLAEACVAEGTGADRTRVVEALKRCASSPYLPQRAAAAAGLMELGDPGGRWAERLGRCLSSADDGEKRKCLLMLAGVCGAIDVLFRFMSDESPEVRAAAVTALSGWPREKVLGMLQSALKDRSPKVRAAAVLSMGRLRCIEIESVLRKDLSGYATREEKLAALQVVLESKDSTWLDAVSDLALSASDRDVAALARRVERVLRGGGD